MTLETILWALLCFLTIIFTYGFISVSVYMLLTGVDFWQAVQMSIKEFKFWE